MPLSAVLEKLSEVQGAFDTDFTTKGRMLVEAITTGDAEAEERLKREIRSLHDLRQRFAPVADDMRKYLIDTTEGHPEDRNAVVLAAATGVGSTEESVEFPQVVPPEPPMAQESGGRDIPLPPDAPDLPDDEETPHASNISSPPEPASQSVPADSPHAEEETHATGRTKDYNKADAYRPFFLEAVFLSPGSKLADIQRKTHELMMNTKVSGVRVGKEGDKQKTDSGVYRYKAQTQALRKRCEQDGTLLVNEDGSFALTEEGERQRWGKMRPKDRTAWAVSMGILPEGSE